MVWCICLVCPVVPLCFMTIGWAKCRPFRGPRHLVFTLNAIAFWGRFPWWGDACVSRYHGPSERLPERRGGPWAPPPLVFLILLAGLLFPVGVRKEWFLDLVMGLLGNQICVSFCRPLLLSLSPFLPPFRSGGWGHRHNDSFRMTDAT